MKKLLIILLAFSSSLAIGQGIIRANGFYTGSGSSSGSDSTQMTPDGWWMFENNAADSSGNGYDLTLSSSPTPTYTSADPPAPVEGTYCADHTGGGWFTYGSSSTSWADSLTFSVWIRPGNNGNKAQVYTDGFQLNVYMSGGSGYCTLGTKDASSNSSTLTPTSTTFLSGGVWSLIVFTLQRGTGAVGTLWHNGSQLSTTGSIQDDWDTTSELGLGATYSGAARAYGYADETMWFDDVILNEDQISYMYNNPGEPPYEQN